MPELPEVETMRRGVAGIAGSRILAVRSGGSRRKPITISPGLRVLRRRVEGARIDAVGRIGKRVVLELDRGDRLIFEPRMTGLVLLADPPNRTHLRLIVELDGDPRQLLFWDRRGLGVVQLLSSEQFASRFAPSRIGPDALQVTAAILRQQLGRSRRPIKVALLDQKTVAGIGNLYASEILHLARVHPQAPCDQLTPAEWRRIQAATLKVLHAAILHEGSTLSDGTYRNVLNQEGGYQNHHRVYDRADLPCTRCRRGAILRIVQAQRSTFYCPICQRA